MTKDGTGRQTVQRLAGKLNRHDSNGIPKVPNEKSRMHNADIGAQTNRLQGVEEHQACSPSIQQRE